MNTPAAAAGNHPKKSGKGERQSERIRAEARGLFCYWAVRDLGYGQAELGRRLGMIQPGVGYQVQRGEHIVKENNFLIEKWIFIYLWTSPNAIKRPK